ncbi:MAG: hypothetical protein VYB65_02555, partial [Myxococcota bacterium]|nr:hypothetical protein [Myxococcota bacterium]
MVVAVTSSCADWIAPIEVGEPCTQRSDCKGFAFCYEGHCVAAPQCNLNGIRESGEECDDGNTNTNDACTNYCLKARCGDRIVRTDLDYYDADYESCEPTIGHPDLDCGTDCILRPASRRLVTTHHGTCALDTPLSARCWGAFYNHAGLSSRLTLGESIRLEDIEFWFGTRLEFPSKIIGFSYAQTGFSFTFETPYPDVPRGYMFSTSWLARAGFQMWVVTELSLLVGGNTQGGGGEPH